MLLIILKEFGEKEIGETVTSEVEVYDKDFDEKQSVSVLFNILNSDFDYSKLDKIDNVYIPLRYFLNNKYSEILFILQQKFKLYIYMPTIIKANYINLFYTNIEKSIKKYDIKGFIMSNISNLHLLKNILNDNNYELISNYTFNTFNNYSVNELKRLGFNKFTISPESDKKIITNLCNSTYLPKELIVYGNTPLMNINYCLSGKTNKCYPQCTAKCNSDNNYYLKDRLNMNFRVLFDNIQTISTIYNSKTTSISANEFNTNSVRIDILDESIDNINYIVNQVINGKRLEGKDYTNGNLNREI